jgi:hypothetical protein
MGKDWVRLLAAVSALALTACGGNDGGAAPAGDAEAAATDGGMTARDALGSTSSDDASEDAADDGPVDAPGDEDVGQPTDAPTTGVSHVPLVHRASAVACTQPRPAGMPHTIGNAMNPEPGTCSGDLDCTSGPDGRCNYEEFPALAADGNRCSYDGCASDSDCSGGVCDCRESPAHIIWGTQTVCLGGNCRTDSDCGQGGYCSPSPALGCGPQSWSAYYCHTPGDQCVDDADCNQGNAYCAYDVSSSRWICSTGICVDG